MLERLNQYRPILFVTVIACGLMTGVIFFLNREVFYICLLAWIILALVVSIWCNVLTLRVKRRFAELQESLEHVMSDAVVSLPMASMIVRKNGEIVWSNTPCKQSVFPGEELFGRNIAELIPDFDWNAPAAPEGRPIEVRGHQYSCYLMHSSSTREALTIISLVDDHDLKHYTQEYFDSRPYVLTMLIDNYTDLFTDSRENERSHTMGEIEHIIETFAEENHAMVKKLERDRYLVVMEERYMKKVIADRFPILNAIRAVDTGERNNATMSIGVAAQTGSLHDSEQLSRQALDMALGRGGDQAALRQKNGYEFFGGTGRGIEKRNKVRARIMANAISDVARTCDNILIMGHRFADLDCVGAAIGMYAGLKPLGKPCHIVLDEQKSLAKQLRHHMRDEKGYESVFVSPARGMELLNRNTLLVVVDTHIPSILESREIYEACKNVVVIDHHRKMVEHIDNAIIFFHEPYASSASEMVTELVQYFSDGRLRLSVAEAEALLSGIMLDTKNFILHTGVRTFEAAAFLRRMGADTVAVRKLFASSMESYQERSRLVSEAEVYNSCAVSCTSGNDPELRVVAPQAADDLLSISGVDASFVLYEQNGCVNISGRSMGAVNVQLILESMGGGGHQTMAGAQVKDITLEDCRQQLLVAIDRYFEENPKGGNES